MRSLKIPVAVLVAAMAVPAALDAQVTPFLVEARIGAAIPTGDFADGLSTGLALEATAGYAVLPILELYGGFSRQSFGVEEDEDFGDLEMDVIDSGFSLGARLSAPFIPFQPWVRGGVLLHEFEIQAREGSASGSISSDRGTGFEIGAGIGVPLAAGLSLTPAVHYRQYSVSFDFEEADIAPDEDMKYLTIGVGVRYRF